MLCANSGGKCGGATTLEINEILANVDNIHQIVFLQALKSLADKRLWSTQGRINFAFKITTNYAQLDLGAGPRRRRILSAISRNQSMDRTVQSDKGDVSGQEIASDKSRDAERRMTSGDVKLARGEKKRGVSGIDEPRQYSLQAIQETLKALEQEAATIDANKDASINSVDVDKLNELIKDKAAVLVAIRDILIRVFVKEGSASPSEIADQWINEKLKEGKTDAVQLIEELKNDPRVARLIGTEVSPTAPVGGRQVISQFGQFDKLAPEDQAKIAPEVQDLIDDLREKGVKDDQIRANLNNITSTILEKLGIHEEDPKYALYQAAIQKDLENRFKLPETPKPEEPKSPEGASAVRPRGLRSFMQRPNPPASDQMTSSDTNLRTTINPERSE